MIRSYLFFLGVHHYRRRLFCVIIPESVGENIKECLNLYDLSMKHDMTMLEAKSGKVQN